MLVATPVNVVKAIVGLGNAKIRSSLPQPSPRVQ